MSDIELLSRVMGSDPYVKEVTPVEMDLSAISKALVLSPHQDDESLGVGGTMALMVQQGIPVEVYYTSDGGTINPQYADSQEEVSRIRFEEARKVADFLGTEMSILGIPDANPRPTIAHLEAFAQKIHDNSEATIFIPWLLDSPPKHRYLHHLLFLTDKYIGLPAITLCQYQVHNTLLPSHFVDISHVIDTKKKCLEFFESQNKYLRPYDHLGIAMSAWNSRLVPEQARILYAEVFFKISLEDNLKLVKKHFFKNLSRTYRGHSSLIKGLSELETSLKAKFGK